MYPLFLGDCCYEICVMPLVVLAVTCIARDISFQKRFAKITLSCLSLLEFHEIQIVDGSVPFLKRNQP